MSQASLALLSYAQDHEGRFPYHTNGYGDALLLLAEPHWGIFTGPGYDASGFEKALSSGSDVDESRCGRVYVQGLSVSSDADANMAILFDKVAAPPDHCHFPRRLWAGFVREVCFVNGTWRMIPVAEWPDFAQKQIDLLVDAGFTREEAQRLYSQVR